LACSVSRGYASFDYQLADYREGGRHPQKAFVAALKMDAD
jgi:translation elongation factor EF-4